MINLRLTQVRAPWKPGGQVWTLWFDNGFHIDYNSTSQTFPVWDAVTYYWEYWRIVDRLPKSS